MKRSPSIAALPVTLACAFVGCSPSAAPVIPSSPQPAAATTTAAPPTSFTLAPNDPLEPQALELAPDDRQALQELGFDEHSLRDALLSSLREGAPVLPDSLRSTPQGQARVELVQRFGPIIKRVVSSPSFRAAYSSYRASALHVDDIQAPAPARSAEQLRQDQLAALEQGIAVLKSQLGNPSIPADVRPTLQQAIAEQETLLRSMQARQDSAQWEAAERERYQQELIAYRQRQQERQQDLKQLNDELPQELNELVARRLREFIALTDTIDFSARLIGSPGEVRRFASASLEAKPSLWKLYFRAGKGPIDEARSFARAWLAELDR